MKHHETCTCGSELDTSSALQAYDWRREHAACRKAWRDGVMERESISSDDLPDLPGAQGGGYDGAQLCQTRVIGNTGRAGARRCGHPREAHGVGKPGACEIPNCGCPEFT